MNFAVFSSILVISFAVFTNGKPANLVAIACARNPDLAMCAGNSDDATFRAFDAPEEYDSRVMRSFPKLDFDELQIERYCDRHQEHYLHYCAGEGSIQNGLRSKILKFCPSFEKYCPEDATKLNSATIKRSLDNFRDSGVPLVEPPPLPSSSQMGGMSFDSPISDNSDRLDQIPERRPESALSPDLIKTCTPDCTAPHCTRECKCANTHPAVHAKCNPPENAALAGVCQAWYNKCPMFKPVSY
jgi:hypothetical protein